MATFAIFVFSQRSHLAMGELSYAMNRTAVLTYSYPVLYDVLTYVTKAPKVISFAIG